jgi:kinesin family protein 15
MEGAGDRVQVYCRVRPPTAEDDGGLQRRCVSVHRDASQVVLHSASEEKTFTFDHAGDESTTQEDVFRSVGVPITEACMDGYNTTIFAYGQTGAGKTYTIVGPDADGAGGAGDCEIHEHSGLTPRVLTYIFAQIARIERTSAGAASFLCTCSYLEIYNENLTDLLRDSSAAAAGGAALAPRLREDLARGIYVENLETVDVATPREAMAVLAAGAANRRVAATSMNKESSRSHAVFTLTIASQTVAPSGLKSTRSSQFNLVDLAGSERQKDTGATGQRLTEACNINKSLSALGCARARTRLRPAPRVARCRRRGASPDARRLSRVAPTSCTAPRVASRAAT